MKDYITASLIRTNWDSGMFGLVNFQINRVLQKYTAGGGGGGGGGIGYFTPPTSVGHNQVRLTT
jgi:hypothetical protein